MELTPEIVFGIIRSDKEFPIDFDEAWRWIGYSSKQKAEDALRLCCIEDIDFSTLGLKSSTGGRRAKHIGLTVEGFKMFCMAAGIAKGREVRLYFLKLEVELNRRIEEERNQSQQAKQHQLVAAMVSEDVVSRQSRFPDSFYEMLYRKRGQGWEKRDPKTFRPSCVGIWTNKTVYDRMLGGEQPGGVKATLNKVNPRRENGTRKDRHHWHLKDLGVM
jgi:phage anti-repressor protein